MEERIDHILLFLIPVSDNVADLKNELLILKDSIRSIMRMIIKMTETNELGQFLIRDEMLENFFSDYFLFFYKKGWSNSGIH